MNIYQGMKSRSTRLMLDYSFSSDKGQDMELRVVKVSQTYLFPIHKGEVGDNGTKSLLLINSIMY